MVEKAALEGLDLRLHISLDKSFTWRGLEQCFSDCVPKRPKGPWMGTLGATWLDWGKAELAGLGLLQTGYLNLVICQAPCKILFGKASMLSLKEVGKGQPIGSVG